VTVAQQVPIEPTPHANAQAVKEFLAEFNPTSVTIDDFDHGLVGYGAAYGVQSEGPVAVYDRELCIQGMLVRGKFTYEEAAEYFDFNVEQAHVGTNTPIIINSVGLA
jgi:hypothetical protein